MTDDDDSNGSNGTTVTEVEMTAAAAYARRLRRCGVMADWLVGQLVARASERDADWAAVGDLGEAERRLAAALAFLVGTDEAAVTAAVDEAVG